MAFPGPALRSTATRSAAGAWSSPWLVPAAVAALGFAVVTTAVGMASGAPPEFLLLDLTIGLVYLGAGLIAWVRRPDVLTGPLLMACSVLNFVGSYGPTERPVLSTLGFAFQGYYDVALAIIVLALPARWPTGLGRWLAVGLLAAFLVRSASRLLLQDPRMFGLDGLPPNPFAVVTDPAPFLAVETASNAMIAVLAIAIALHCVWRIAASKPLVRRVLWPILVAGIVAMSAAAFDAAETAVSTATGTLLLELPEPWDEVFEWSLFGLRLFVPIGLLVGSLRLDRAGGPLVALAVGLGRVPSPTRLQSALAAALGDPDVRLLRPDPDGRGWTAADGRPAAAPVEDRDHAVTMLEHEGKPLAAIVHDPVLREDPALVRSVMAVLRLAVENERLDSALQTQLEEVRASRARLVLAAEDERRRIERDLHDGAQQRLVGVTIALQQARQTAAAATPIPPELQDQLTSAAEEVQAAIQDLRELARGIHPALLEDEGLRAAVAALGRRASLPVETHFELDRRLPRHIESTAYFTVAEALTNTSRHAQATRADVTVRDLGDRLEILIDDNGIGGADPSRGSGLSGLADRLASVDGRLRIESPARGGTRVQAEVPLP